MTRFEILDADVDLPLEIPPAAGGHSSVPGSLADAMVDVQPGDLVCWSDARSNTVGVAKSNKVIVVEQSCVRGLSMDFMRPAKGRGWVSLEADLDGRTSVVLLQALTFKQEGVDWLLTRRAQIESVFGVKLAVGDHGFDY